MNHNVMKRQKLNIKNSILYARAAEGGRMRGKMRVSGNTVNPYSAYATDKSYADRIITE